MSKRIEMQRQDSIDAVERISVERALLLTEFYRKNEAERVSIPMKRALAFQHIMLNKTIKINRGELIVGERGDEPKATPTYPEVCLHSLEDLDVLDSREKVFFRVSESIKKQYEETIIPYWTGKSMRERIFNELSDQWKTAYEAGMFTEFQEQRTPGHTVLGDKIYQKGLETFIDEIESKIQSLDFLGDMEALDKREELLAMKVSALTLIDFSERYADELEQMSTKENNAERKQELLSMSEICRHVPGKAPRTFWEALQYYWFVHIGVITETNPWDSFNPGRLDQHLYPFYKKDIETGTLTVEWAKELLKSFWIKFNNHPAPPKVGITAKESNTYTDFALINIGGLKADGSNAVNELSYLILDVIKEMRLLQPSSMIQLSKKSPDRFLKHALKIVKTGFGQPSIFNSDTIVQELVRQGKSVEDARNGGASGCVESGAFGTESYILTGYFNLTKILEITLHNGIDPLTGNQLGLLTGELSDLRDFEEFMSAYEKQLRHFIDIKIQGNNIIERLYAKYLPTPFLSLFIDDCIANGKDYNAGGARYNTAYIQGVGLGSVTDSLISIKKNLYEENKVTAEELLNALQVDFKGFENLQTLFRFETPKYGNDLDEADQVMQKVFEIFYDAVNNRPTTKGGRYRINLLPTTSHIYFGNMIGAMPDGRNAGKPLSEGISPVQGADTNGPGAVVKSAGKIDHIRTGGTLLNQKFTPQLMENQEGIDKVASLVRSYFKLDGHHIQFNVVDAETLKKAQQNPEEYRSLIVRVAGYSDYFVHLTRELQDEIIMRTEHANTM
ncbi:glycyl radical protein [bacterium]|nr:glycyl radical protein [bacterium]